MSDDKSKNGRISLSTVAVIVGLIAGPFAVWGTLNAEAGRTKEKVDQLERRQAEDRRSIKEDQHEIKRDVKETREAVQKILIKLEAQEARERSRR